ncbi:MAG: S8 family serine peptidase, partial [candidate division KSB1 bacterium]|nr:S8 family serine peptidase [candidate division KSB1 bacterium]
MKQRVMCLILLLFLPALTWSQQKYWIFFRDKGLTEAQESTMKMQAKAAFSQHALERRAKMFPKNQLITEDDLPLFAPYLQRLAAMKVEPIVQSRWLNAISAMLNAPLRQAVEALPFVREVRLVARYARPMPMDEPLRTLPKVQAYQIDYGPSLTQNAIMHVPEVHELGLDGSGVVIGMLDTGFDYKYHEAFSQLRVKAEYDFINQDSVTTNEDKNKDASSQHNHGTYTLSAIGGFAEGRLVGPAYGATYLLAKTEVVPTETPIEEDYWVAGLEWLERLGADVVNSSLGYLDWYTYENMDGQTAVTTIAADKAVLKGVVVVNSMGNEGNSSWHYMIAPADGFNVIAVGAVYSTGDIVSFSSRGPTYDGRVKPDVVAMGAGVHVAEASTVDSYRQISGTSLSSPLTAGVAALVLQAHPYLTPFEVRDALRNTADRVQMPDNDYGWGLINAQEAIFYHGLFFSRMPKIE